MNLQNSVTVAYRKTFPNGFHWDTVYIQNKVLYIKLSYCIYRTIFISVYL